MARTRFGHDTPAQLSCYSSEAFSLPLAREQFSHPATPSLFKKLEQLSHRSGVSRGVAFEDWLTAMVCALAAETKEGDYLAMVERHKAGKQRNSTPSVDASPGEPISDASTHAALSLRVWLQNAMSTATVTSARKAGPGWRGASPKRATAL